MAQARSYCPRGILLLFYPSLLRDPWTSHAPDATFRGSSSAIDSASRTGSALERLGHHSVAPSPRFTHSTYGWPHTMYHDPRSAHIVTLSIEQHKPAILIPRVSFDPSRVPVPVPGGAATPPLNRPQRPPCVARRPLASPKPAPRCAEYNFDVPEAFDEELLLRCIDALLAGEPFDVPIYDFTTHSRSGGARRVEPADVLIVEGILVLHSQEVIARMNMKVGPTHRCACARHSIHAAHSTASVPQREPPPQHRALRLQACGVHAATRGCSRRRAGRCTHAPRSCLYIQ